VVNTNAVFDVSSLQNPALQLHTGQSVSGLGSVKGSVSGFANSSINPGSSTVLGKLTITTNGSSATTALVENGGVNNVFFLTTPASSNDLIVVQGDLDLVGDGSGGQNNISLNKFGGGSVNPGNTPLVFPLITYTGNLLNGGPGSFAPAVGPFAYTTIYTNIDAHTLGVIVSPPPRQPTNLVWTGNGAGNVWDGASTNWLNTAGTAKFSFLAGDSVAFTDLGTTNPTVNINVSVYPIAMTITNTTNYTFNGAGGIYGPTGLTKTNKGAVFMNTLNGYTGPTIILGGEIVAPVLANGGTVSGINNSSIGSANNNATNLIFQSGGILGYTGPSITIDRQMTLNIPGGGVLDITNGTTLKLSSTVAFNGPGGLTVTNSGTLDLPNADVTYSGPVTNNGATIIMENALSLGQGNITMKSGTLELLSQLTVTNNFNVAGNFNVLLNATAQINPSFNGIFSGNGNLTMASTGNAANNFDFNTAGSIGNWTGSFQFADNGPGGYVRQTSPAGQNPWPKTLGLDMGMGTTPSTWSDRNGNYDFFAHISGGTNTTFSGPYAGTTFPMTADVGWDNTSTEFDGHLFENAAGFGSVMSLVKDGTGTWTLGGNVNISGLINVSNGVLNLVGNLTTGAAIPNNPTNNYVAIYHGTFAGNGTNSLAVTNYSGILAPGAASNVVGTVMVVNNNVTMMQGGTNIMNVSHSATDKITVGGSGVITYGGMLLVVTNGDAPLSTSDTFPLFNIGSGGATGSFNTIQPSPGASLAWDDSTLTTDGILRIKTLGTAALTANFNAGPTNGAAALAVTFTNLSSQSPNATLWQWNFGDGSISNDVTGGNVTHTYTLANFTGYTNILTVFGPAGSLAYTNPTRIVVTNLPPVAGYTQNVTSGFLPLVVTFTNQTTGVATGYLWSFGDGAISNTASAGTVTHTYTSVGTYGVGLTATGTGGSNLATNANYITATNLVVATTPTALFTNITPARIFVGQSVTFTNTSLGGITNSTWTFGDGGITNLAFNLATNNVTHVYTNNGSFTVTLVVTNSPGSSSTNTTTLMGYSIVVQPKPTIASTALTGGQLILSGVNGVPNAPYRILTSPTVTNSLSLWTPVWTNTFSATGSYSYTNSTPTNGASFFILVSP
jgi:autotransporter-associated beta strand protein